MFSEKTLREPVADALAVQLAEFSAPVADPMPCDRWVARSLIHKAIRRGDVVLAWRALATLLREHPAGVWRSLTIIAMEDVGVSGVDALCAVVAASKDRRWRHQHGGEWKVAAFLVRDLCIAAHDQAVCDLFHHAQGNPAKSELRDETLDSEIGHLARCLQTDGLGLIDQGIIALAIGGGLADGQRHRDPFAVFEMFAERKYCWEVVELSRAAWRISRCELALLVPLIWAAWRQHGTLQATDDTFPPVSYIGYLPGYAVDQFTRSGIQVSRKLLSNDRELQQMLDDGGIARNDQHRTVGDLIFLIEGSPLSRRAIWSIGDELRLPHRCLLDTVKLGNLLSPALGRVAAQGPLIANLRRELLPPSRDQQRL